MNEESILAVTGSVAQPSAFGTGFIIYRDENVTYWVTCAHVIEDIGGEKGVKIDGQEAEVIAIGKPSGNDLAVLAVKSGLFDKQPLPLASSGKKGDRFTTYGYRLSVTSRVSRELQGTLGKSGQIAIGQGGRLIRAWDLEVTDTDPLEKGYSGSPVFDDSGHVIAVVSQRQSDGRKGQAIAIAALKEIWADMPSDLLKSISSQNPTISRWLDSQLPSFQKLKIAIQSSLIVSIPIIVIRFLGILQPAELWAYDQLIRLNIELDPNRFIQDHRLLVIEITEEDIAKWKQDPRSSESIPESTLAELLTKLEEFEPKATGLDIYRDFSAEDPKLAKILKENDRLFSVCKIPDESLNPRGIEAPTEVPDNRQGFSDFVTDAGGSEGVLRRQLLYFEHISNVCSTNYSLSLRLVLQYFQQDKLELDKNDVSLRIDGTPFKPLTQYFGGYQYIEGLGGYQVLLNYSSPDAIEKITLTDVLEGSASIDRLKNRIILIGVTDTTDPSLEDDWDTPLGQERGIIIHAQMVRHLLRIVEGEETLIWVRSGWEEWLWIWGWALTGGILGGLWGSQKTLRNFVFATSTATAVLWFICILVFCGWSGWLPSIPSTFALVLAGTGSHIYIGYAFRYRNQ